MSLFSVGSAERRQWHDSDMAACVFVRQKAPGAAEAHSNNEEPCLGGRGMLSIERAIRAESLGSDRSPPSRCRGQ